MSRSPVAEDDFGRFVARAEAAWPGVRVDRLALLRELTRAVPVSVRRTRGLAKLHDADLYLVLACRLQNPVAMRRLRDSG